jgi:6-phosphofructokinase 1
MKRISVLASGGDAPGMNACVRAVVRTATARGIEVIGVRDGYGGLLTGELVPLDRAAVAQTINRGGILLGTGRCDEFERPEGRARAAETIRRAGIEALIAIGGDGTCQGAADLAAETGLNVIFLPGTIDNDVPGTDYSIGFDTAVNTALQAVDRIRDTAEALERVFFVEVMGRECGALALEVGLAGGADAILIPESSEDAARLPELLRAGIERGSRGLIVVVAEGDEAGGAFTIAKNLSSQIRRDCRVTVVGHIQRGGSPTARDRVLATRLGVAAVEALLEGRSGVAIGEVKGEIAYTDLPEAARTKKRAPLALLQMAYELA